MSRQSNDEIQSNIKEKSHSKWQAAEYAKD